MMKSLQVLWQSLALDPKSDFLVTPTQKLTRKELQELIQSFLAGFDQHHLCNGDRIIILLDDEAAAIAGFLAAMLDGLTPVMLTPDTPTARVASIASSVEAKAALTSATQADQEWLKSIPAKFMLEPENTPKKRLFSKPSVSQILQVQLTLPTGGREPRLPESPDHTAYLLFTSGTTSEPTGVIISQQNVLANLHTISRVLEVTSTSRVLNDMVLAHGDGLVQGPLLALYTGSTLVRTGTFDLQKIEVWLNSIRSNRITHFITVATLWSMIDRYAQEDDYFDAPEFITASSVAATLNTEQWQRLEQRFGIQITNQYGLTETAASALYAGSHPEAGAVGTIGKPIDCQARIATLDNDSGLGELQLQGNNIFAGYWNNPERTQATFTDDGWMMTGDLVKQAADGSFEMLGRKKAVIMSGGFLIRPEEVDEVMLRHPAISMSVTVGIKDPTFEEVAMTVVQSDSELSEAELLSHAQQQLESLKVPKKIIQAPKIPLGPAGKPQLNEVREMIENNLRSSGNQVTTDNTELKDRILQIAAEVFRTSPSDLSLRTTSKDIPGWDSFAQIALIVALEEDFQCKISASKAASIRSLDDAFKAISG